MLFNPSIEVAEALESFEFKARQGYINEILVTYLWLSIFLRS